MKYFMKYPGQKNHEILHH